MQLINFKFNIQKIWGGLVSTRALELVPGYDSYSSKYPPIVHIGTVKCINCNAHLLSEEDYSIIIQHEIVESLSVIFSGFDHKGSTNQNEIMHKILPKTPIKECHGALYDLEEGKIFTHDGDILFECP